MFCENHNAGVGSSLGLHAGADKRSLSDKQRHGLALHVGSHKSAVGIVIFKERNKSGGDRNYLLGADVHKVDGVAPNKGSVLAVSSSNAFVKEPIVLVERFIGLSDNHRFFVVSGHVNDVLGYDSAPGRSTPYHSIRGFDKAELIDASVIGKGADKADVGSFRRFNGAHASVVRVVNVANFKAGAFAT